MPKFLTPEEQQAAQLDRIRRLIENIAAVVLSEVTVVQGDDVTIDPNSPVLVGVPVGGETVGATGIVDGPFVSLSVSDQDVGSLLEELVRCAKRCERHLEVLTGDEHNDEAEAL